MLVFLFHASCKASERMSQHLINPYQITDILNSRSLLKNFKQFLKKGKEKVLMQILVDNSHAQCSNTLTFTTEGSRSNAT